MSNTPGRVVASIDYSTTNEPVFFVVESQRADAVVKVLNPDLRDMYLRAWRDAVSAVMDDCGWTYEAIQASLPLKVERVRTGRPRVIHGTHIETQLARAVKAVDDVLDSILMSDVPLAGAVSSARAANPVSFQWRITEQFAPVEDHDEKTIELLGSSYIDLSTKPPLTAKA